jgi:hypothetical protein
MWWLGGERWGLSEDKGASGGCVADQDEMGWFRGRDGSGCDVGAQEEM